MVTYVLGLGQSGLSVIRHYHRLQQTVKISDNRSAPPNLAELQHNWPEMGIEPWDAVAFSQADSIVLSPGLSPMDPILGLARQAGVPIIGDIECFVQAAKAPIIAITGTNAKGTVTTLIGEMIRQAGFSVLVGGNIGTPALDLLLEPTPDYYVLELSSFQLETVFSLKAEAAVILNLSEDHLDRHGTLADYLAAKLRIYHGAKHCVVNRDQQRLWPEQVSLSFGSTQEPGGLGLCHQGNDTYLAYGERLLLNTRQLRIKGTHNAMNALAALALGMAIDLPLEAMLTALEAFPGLPHRCQFVKEKNGVQWYDDSKGTNVGATLAALCGLGSDHPIVLIAGGQGKGQDFQPLCDAVHHYCRVVIVFGQDADLLKSALQSSTTVLLAADLADAVDQAKQHAQTGDIVLLSPACASLDMFKNYEDRGRQFVSLVWQQDI